MFLGRRGITLSGVSVHSPSAKAIEPQYVFGAAMVGCTCVREIKSAR